MTSSMRSMEEIARAFALFDTDNSGKLSQEKLIAVLTRPTTSKALSEADVQSIVKQFDVDGDGLLDLDEFSRAWSSWNLGGGSKEKLPSPYQLSRWESKAKHESPFEAALKGRPSPIRFVDAHWLAGQLERVVTEREQDPECSANRGANNSSSKNWRLAMLPLPMGRRLLQRNG